MKKLNLMESEFTAHLGLDLRVVLWLLEAKAEPGTNAVAITTATIIILFMAFLP